MTSFAFIGTNTFAAVENNDVVRSTDTGTTWDTVNAGLEGNIWCLAPVGTDLFAGTLGVGGPFSPDSVGVYVTTNNGAHWAMVDSGLTCRVINCLAVVGSALYAGTGFLPVQPGGVFRSTDSGSSWTQMNSGLTKSVVLSLFADGSYLFAGTNGSGGGVFLSTSSGSAWSSVSAGLTDTTVNALAVEGGYLFAGTENGIWRRTVAEMVTGINTVQAVRPETYNLDQNYPNPFNPSTTIRYGLPFASRVTLTLYNTLGEQIATLVDGEHAAGNHEVRLERTGLASGVYFYRLSVGSFAETRKLLLEK